MGIGGNGCLHGNCESYHFDRSLVIGQVKSDSFGVVIAKLSNKYGTLRRSLPLVRAIGSCSVASKGKRTKRKQTKALLSCLLMVIHIP